MKRLILFVSGKVQQAGYRDKIVELGRSLGLTGYAENLPDGRVKVVAEGEEKKLEQLAHAANIKNTLISVEDIERSYSEASGDFSDFSKLVRGGETDERLDTAASLLKELIYTTKQGFSSLNDTVRSGFNITAEKQDLQLKITEKGFSEIKGEMAKGFADMRKSSSDIKEEIHLLRDDFKEMFMQEVKELRKEIAEVKATLARMQAAG